MPLDRVTIRPIDTAFTPFDRSTGSSRSTTVMGKAVELAGSDARRQIVELASDHFECPEDAITLKDGEAIAGGKKITYGELINNHFAIRAASWSAPVTPTAAWRRRRRIRCFGKSASARWR